MSAQVLSLFKNFIYCCCCFAIELSEFLTYFGIFPLLGKWFSNIFTIPEVGIHSLIISFVAEPFSYN
jgi:hypothetical protein